MAWLSARGVKQPRPPANSCEEMSIGTPATAALLCVENVSRCSRSMRPTDCGGLLSIEKLILVTASRGTMQTLWNVPIAVSTGLMKAGPPVVSETYHVKLEPIFSEDNTVATLRETAEAGCGHLSHLDEERRQSDRGYASDVQTQIKIVCAARGQYDWKGGRFVRR